MKTALNGKAAYGGNITANLERLYLTINNRYPFVEICGPYAETEIETEWTADTTLEYCIKYYINVNDRNLNPDTEITYLTRNVTNQLVKLVMADQQRSGLAKDTKVTDYGNAFELLEDNVEFFIYVIIEIQALINPYNHYVIG